MESKYIRGSERVREAIGKFGPKKTYQRFESHGVPLKIEKDMRVFPVSNNGKDIVGVFEQLFNNQTRHPDRSGRISSNSAIHVKLATGINSITRQNNTFVLQSGTSEWGCDAVIIATGGQAYRQTGSTGDAYDRAQSL